MAIGLAESLTERGWLDQQHLGDTFKANFKREPWRGYAVGPPIVFNLVEVEGISYSEAAHRVFGGNGSFGNGAAMRIAPVGLCFHDALNLYEQARTSAIVTHAHPLGIDGAAVLARAIAQVVKLDPQEPFPVDWFCQDLIDFAQNGEIRDKMKLVKTLLAENTPSAKAADQLGRSVATHESMPFAIYAFLRHPESFEDCLFSAVLNGGDRDTMGAMACAVSGAYLGLEAIPPTWREKLENRRHIEELAVKLVKLVERKM
jgi:poly(ADP-ribose) glycohydrolase ARH3